MSDGSPVIDAWGRVRSAVLSLFNTLNALGAVVLAYALANPTAASDLVKMMPEQYRPYAPLAALAWFVVVQMAKMSAIKKAQGNQ